MTLPDYLESLDYESLCCFCYDTPGFKGVYDRLSQEKLTRAQLIEAIKRTDEEQAPKRVGFTRIVPTLLPYMPDRSKQNRMFREAFKRRQRDRPFVCFIPGQRSQCHDKFLEYLREYTLPMACQLSDQDSVIQYNFRCPKTCQTIEELHQSLQRRLSEQILYQDDGSLDQINIKLAQVRRPVIINTALFTTDWQQHRFDPIAGLLMFWQNWPALRRQSPLIVCVFIEYMEPALKSSWDWVKRFFPKSDYHLGRINDKIRRQLDDLAATQVAASKSPSCVILPELTNVSFSDVIDWARVEVIRIYPGQYIVPAINAIFEPIPIQEGLPMETLAHKLAEILAWCRTQEGDSWSPEQETMIRSAW